jgi:hypothetical protein
MGRADADRLLAEAVFEIVEGTGANPFTQPATDAG